MRLVRREHFIATPACYGEQTFKTVMETDNAPTASVRGRYVTFNDGIDAGAVTTGVKYAYNHILLMLCM